MDFNKDFIPLAIRTESVIAPITMNRPTFTAVLDACIIVGNLADVIKKKAAYNKPINLANWNALVQQLTDILPFISDMTDDSFVGNEVIDVNTRLFHGIFGQFTESTELMEALQVAIETKAWDYPNLKEEIGDTAWYQAILLDEMGGNMDDIQRIVIQKLQTRYPDKYSDQAAITRNLVAERVVLES
jgi:NTP pyrophosphatase (non-canonical NTP hydrolase)